MAQAQERAKEASVSVKRGKYIVAAIDFGTTYSGFAFSLKHDFKKDPLQHIITNTWDVGLLKSEKAPTYALFDGEGNFHSFGYEAEEKYGELALDEDEDLDDWFYFERFKMKLFDQKIDRALKIADKRGKQMPAKTVFRECIKHLKEQLLHALEKKATTFTLDDIHWVLTVPAIWSDAAKQFMRESAAEAGIDGALLSIALEPEAASLYCQHQHLQQNDQSGMVFEPTKAGTKYAIIDLGGGTVDIAVHEKQQDGALKELTSVSGGAWGGMYVNMAFENFLISIFGADIFTQFKDECPDKALDMQRDFESRKRSFKPNDEGKMITICLVDKLLKLYKKKYGEDIKEGIKQHPHASKVEFVAKKIRVDFLLFKTFFKASVDKIVNHIKELVHRPEVKDVKRFMLVGGYSQSELVFSAIKDALPGATVINPPEPGLAVLKGAVIFGHSPLAVSSRIARYSYGVNISPTFDDSIHSKDRKVTLGKTVRCKDVFKKYIEKGSQLAYGMQAHGKHVTIKDFQTTMELKVYVSTSKNPKYCDEDGTDYAGKLLVTLPAQKEKIIVEVNFIVGETELKVEAEEQASNNTFEAFFDFL